MQKVASVLRDEVRRLAKKESNAGTRQLRKDNARLKRDVAGLKRQVAALEKDVMRLVPEVANLRKKSIDPEAREVKEARFGPKLIAALRKRLKVSRKDFASLLSVSAQTTMNWESGVTSPSSRAKATLVDLRKIGVREARKRLEEA